LKLILGEKIKLQMLSFILNWVKCLYPLKYALFITGSE